MYTISKEFHFSASHQLMGLPAEHPCSNMHGHNYKVRVILQSATLNQNGFVVDYRDLEPIKTYIDVTMDHKHLNDVLSVNPTAENIAKAIFRLWQKKFPQMVAVEVSETDKTWARYEPNYDS